MQRVAGYERILSMTNLELVRYLKAMRSAVITENAIHNPSNLPLWFGKGGEVICVQPGTVWNLEV